MRGHREVRLPKSAHNLSNKHAHSSPTIKTISFCMTTRPAGIVLTHTPPVYDAAEDTGRVGVGGGGGGWLMCDGSSGCGTERGGDW